MRNEGPSDKMKRAIKNVFWLYVALFTGIIVYLLYFMIFTRNQIINNPHNPRLFIYDNEVMRGKIYDANLNVIAYTEKKENAYLRVYNYDENMCHIVGYTAKGRSGIEAAYNFELQKLHNQFWQKIRKLFDGSDLIGNAICLTIDMDIQQAAYELLDGKKGAIVVMEPDTGKILAMASFPNFNANTIEQNWGELIESEDAPLLNRASQGLYTPGSVFKIISSLAIMEEDIDYKIIKHNCEGSQQFGNKIIHCFDEKEHGEIDMYDAMAYSCNTFFSHKIYELGAERLIESAEKRLFNKALFYPLEYSQSIFQLSATPTESEIVETAIGQGKTLVSPLYMAMLTAAVANDGIVMRPYIVDYSITYNDKIKSKNIPKMLESVFAVETAEQLKTMMRQVVENGTGAAANIDNVFVAGKTGTAENPGGTAHSWFTSFAEANGKKAVVTVVLENPKVGQSAVPIAAEVIRQIFD